MNGIIFRIVLRLEIIVLTVQSKAKMHCAQWQLVSADTHEILHNWGKAVFVCKHPKAPIVFSSLTNILNWTANIVMNTENVCKIIPVAMNCVNCITYTWIIFTWELLPGGGGAFTHSREVTIHEQKKHAKNAGDGERSKTEKGRSPRVTKNKQRRIYFGSHPISSLQYTETSFTFTCLHPLIYYFRTILY